MKKLLTILLFIPSFLFAQKTHTVGPKESLFSIGRLYNVHPRELANFNNIAFETGVKIGQVLKIPAKPTMAPLSETNTVAPAPEKTNPVVAPPPVVKPAPVAEKPKPLVATPPASPKGLSPIFHKVQKKETLFQISSKYEGATIDNIKKWNNLTTDGLNEGMNLIVGYKAATTEKPTPKPAPATTPTTETIAPVKPAPVAPVVKSNEPIAEKPSASTRNFSGGFFKSLYNNQVAKGISKTENGTGAAFKSTSGWDDGRYYCLHNSASVGTIIKITNPSNQKFVYAKVLDVIPDLKQNKGILIRLSNAAADELGYTDETFDVELSY